LLMTIFLLVACSGNNSLGAAQANPITVDNDSAVAGDLGVVTNPTAGRTVGPTQSEGVEFDSQGSVAPPDPYPTPGDFLGETTGTPPLIAHGAANGDTCMACHNNGSGGTPIIPRNHTESGLDDSYCRNCHQDA
jgi:hypothetical protein